MAKKDLKYYLENTDEMPTDPKEIEQLAREHMQASMEISQEELTTDRFVKPDSEKTEEGKDEKKGESSDAETKEVKEDEPKEKKEEESVEKTESKPDGVLAKDGKNLIPYSQLESARQRAIAAEQLAAEQAAEIDRLKNSGKENTDQVDLLTDEELNALEVDSPTLAKVLRAQQNIIHKLNTTVQELADRQNGQLEQEATTVKSEIQMAIDANPTLAEWQTAEDQTLWDEAARFDKVLRESPKYANVSFEERFKKVVELTQSALGLEVEKPKEEHKEEPKDEVKPTQAEIKAAAAAKLKSKSTTPKSLSDIPGGAEPVSDERERIEQMSPTELGSKFLKMTQEQINAYLTTL